MNIIHKRVMYIVLLILSITAYSTFQSGLSSATKSVKYNETIEDIRELIEDEMNDEDVVGLSIALIDDQELVWAEGFGYADLKKKIKATPRTVYRTGSWSELFTAAGIFRLMKAGKIDIDKPIDKYLPGFSIKSYSSEPPLITIKNILTHHGGFQSDLFKGKYN